MKNYLLGFGIVLLLSVNEIGCAAGHSIDDSDMSRTYLFAPQGDLLQRLVPLAADRWAAAGCFNIEMDPAGIPWTIESNIDRGDGVQATAATYMDMRRGMPLRVMVHDRNPHKFSSILHEMAHAFGVPEHASGHGVFSNDPHHNEIIDEESLSRVCEWVECGCFNPETPSAHPTCGMAFDSAPELLQETLSAAARWSAATGCDVRVEAGGVPIRAQDFLPDGDCGLATWDEARTGVQTIDVAMVDISCLPPYTVLHEMGHALAGIQGHALSGVMAPASSKAKSTKIDEASLTLVCTKLNCMYLHPEN